MKILQNRAQGESRLAFFQQSGWMMIATVASGVFMYAVHIAAKRMAKEEYGVFTTLLQILNLMSIPAAGLQSVFAQQTAAALSPEQHHQLTGAFRAVLKWTFLFWLVIAVTVLLLSPQVQATLQINNPAALYILLLVGLGSLWLPIMYGLLQGVQSFLWLGLATITNGVGRFLSVTVIVLLLGGQAAGAMGGALLGIVAALAVCFWQTRALWQGESSPFNVRDWMGRIIPLTLGLGTCMFMLSADMIVVQAYFPAKQTGLYAAAGMIGRALVFFTIPLAAVMFPKIVRSAARAEPTRVLGHALTATFIMGALAATACTLFPALPLWLVYDESFLAIAPLVPWFAWCMLPLTLANVLINNLLARSQFTSIPWLMAVAAGYGTALFYFHDTFFSVVRTLGLFNLLLLAVSAWFTWRGSPSPHQLD